MPDRRTIAVLLAATVAASPAVALKVLCTGKSCGQPARAAAKVPFCSLPEELRTRIAKGYMEGRSPDILAVTAAPTVASARPFGGLRWPSLTARGEQTAVPIAFWGDGLPPGIKLPAGTGLDDVAPTLARLIGLRRPHPEVRSGTAIPGLSAPTKPDLVLEVVLEGVGGADLETDPRAWKFLRTAMAAGASTTAGDAGSLPLDPVAVLTTIGTGGLPNQHGITGVRLRTEDGATAAAWSRRAPGPVIATLADHLDELNHQRPRIALIAPDRRHRGLIGGSWYLDHDKDDLVFGRRDAAAALDRLLSRGYGKDGMTDLVAVVLRGPARRVDTRLQRIVQAARKATDRLVVAVAGTGSTAPLEGATPATHVRRLVNRSIGDVVDAVAVGGLFLDHDALARRSTADDDVARSMTGMRSPRGVRLFADVFTGLNVTFARYC